jgi:hypothetical protein
MGEKDLDTLRSGFLLRSPFDSAMGKETSYELTSRRAYRDLCRTLASRACSARRKPWKGAPRPSPRGFGRPSHPAPLTWDGYAEKHQALCVSMSESTRPRLPPAASRTDTPRSG